MAGTGTVVGLLLLLAALGGNWWWNQQTRKAQIERVRAHHAKAPESLRKHSKVFNEPKVVKVTPRIHMAIGFALANSILIEGDEGVIIVDVTESVQAGRRVMAAFRNVTKKPIKAIIYTHNHGDHVYGAKAFIEDPRNPPEVWAHASILAGFRNVYFSSGAISRRAMRQFGVFVDQHINSGIGFNLQLGRGGQDPSFVYPTKLFPGKERDIRIAGVDLKLVHIPGETVDQIGVWVPGERAFLCADDIYRAFPNLYAIRGTPSRHLLDWQESVDVMLTFEPEVLVPSHTDPIHGKEAIRDLLTIYRDAIQFVHDQTLRYMNKGYLPDEIAALVHLPEHVASHPYLYEFYGTVEWSSKGVFNTYLGWFSGDPVDLSPLTPDETARRMVDLVGKEKLVQEARKAQDRKEHQWALMLSSYVTRTDPGQGEARQVKVDALMSLGDLQTSANGRNYYHTMALEEVDETVNRENFMNRGTFVQEAPMMEIFTALRAKFKAEDCLKVNSTVIFEFKDTKQVVTLTIRNAVAVVSDRPAKKYDIKVKVTEKKWREILLSKFAALTSLATGDVDIEGSLLDFKNVMGCFESQ